jgi:hypothetical protein
MQLIDDGPDARPQQSEQQALEAKALLAMALRLGRLGAWVVNLPQRTVEFSPEARLIHELAGDFQLTVEGIAALMDPQSQPRVAAAIQACIDDGRGFDLEAQAHTGSSGSRAPSRTSRKPGKRRSGRTTWANGWRRRWKA